MTNLDQLRTGAIPSGEASGRLLFVNKKKQKNFFTLGCAGFSVIGPM
jgi:hypothetical protein